MAFAAETHDALENARGKLAQKRADLIVVNEVGVDRVFGADHNTVTLLGADGMHRHLRRTPQRRCGRYDFGPVVASAWIAQVGAGGTVDATYRGDYTSALRCIRQI